MSDALAAAGRAPTAEVLRSRLRLEDLDPGGARVLVRADFNVPVAAGTVTDENRILATLPTLRRLLDAGARVIVASHLGRPGGARDPAATLAPVVSVLERRLGCPVTLAPDCVGPEAEKRVAALSGGEVLLLENLRYHAGEKANDPTFVRALAALADVYVNDAFGACHRAHASIVGVPMQMGHAAAGVLLTREVEKLSRVLLEPTSPFVLVLGGAKVEDKVGLIGNLLPLLERVVIGGAMANAFLAARGRAIGRSLAPAAAVREARSLLERAGEAGVEVVLPTDLVVAPAIERGREATVVTEVPEDQMALDIGPDSARRFAEALDDAATVVWNGPMGVFEYEAFAEGSLAVARAIADRTDAYTVVGGGDTASAAALAGIIDSVSHVSTGGGASLDLLSGGVLPGVDALSERAR